MLSYPIKHVKRKCAKENALQKNRSFSKVIITLCKFDDEATLLCFSDTLFKLQEMC